MKKIIVTASIWLASNAFAYEFKCDVELYNSTGTEKFTLFSENDKIQKNLNGNDVSIQFAHRQEIPSLSDYYSFSIFGPDTGEYVFSGDVIENCGFGTNSLQIVCTPVK